MTLQAGRTLMFLLYLGIALVFLGSCQNKKISNVDDQSVLPNIILILTDDQGFGDLGVHGNSFVQTPHLDALARTSASLVRFNTDPTCSPTRAALLTGQHSLRAGVWHTIAGRSTLPTEKETIAELLRDIGYRTGIFGKWHLGDNIPYTPSDQGFQHAVIHGGGGVGQTPDHWGNTQFDDTYFVNGSPQLFEGNSTDIWFDQAEAFINTQDERPFFAFISTNAPHAPWRAPRKYIEPYRDRGLPEQMARFYAMITHVDERVGRLRQMLSERNLSENTIVIFMGDNGSALRLGAPYFEETEAELLQLLRSKLEAGESLEYNSGLRGFKGSVYEGGYRVPFFIHWPNAGIDVARIVESPIAHYDLAPTLIELIGATRDAEYEFDGDSFASLLRSEPDTATETKFGNRSIVVSNQRVFTPNIDRPAAVINGPWRYVRNQGETSRHLFNIETDPGQIFDVASENPEVVANLETDYQNWWATQVQESFPPTRIPVGLGQTPEVRLTAMDWMDEAANAFSIPWFPGFQPAEPDPPYIHWLNRETSFKAAPWFLSVRESGEYRVQLYLHDRPAAQPINRAEVVLEVGSVQHIAKVHGLASYAEFNIDLEEGPIDLKGYFRSNDAGIDDLPAFYVYIRRVGPTQTRNALDKSQE